MESNSVRAWLDSWLPEFEEQIQTMTARGDAYDHTLWEAMQYSLMAGGKRIRPAIMMLTALSLGASKEEVLPFAAALEMIHTYSLIHDDLPAMDNDDYRRNRLTNHKVFGEATAILAGDGLLNLAYEIMAEAVTPEHTGSLDALRYIAHGAGPKGMVAGQIADIEAEEQPVDEEGLLYIDHNKTGCLLTSAFVAGGCLAQAERSVLESLERAGFMMGTAFQIQDDILDVEGSLEELGKAPGSDEQNHKTTFVSLYGLKAAKDKSKQLSEEAIAILTVLPGTYGAMVRELVASMIDRTK